MVRAVPLFIRRNIRQTEICRQVHHPHRLWQRLDHLLRRRVGQTAENNINPGKIRILDFHKTRQRQAAEAWKHLGKVAPCLAIAAQQAHRSSRMAVQQTDQLDAGIATGAQNGD